MIKHRYDFSQVEVPEALLQAEVTQEETVPVMTEPEWLHETQPEVEEEPEGNRNGLWFGLFLITGTLSLVLLGALVFRRRSY